MSCPQPDRNSTTGKGRNPGCPDAPDDWPQEQGRPLGLRLLALLGAVAFVMLGLNSLLPALQPPVPRPQPDAEPRNTQTTSTRTD